ncbi:hypothetical protein BC939DRAFT_6586 [Gamsiella multidivaricata]|uniref:uncharacterized protein n=1 Tax=Gamsiella multidivaricata TaxID=101098 RepID=UPI002220C7D3|nr:uncharacterized protein BC939DRAFT_6586 [Gamsiella multidivaricata]KAI7832807.1 hypothetical protein BC939DRAFT_6586 [Gamsiella multidivaricata]
MSGPTSFISADTLRALLSGGVATILVVFRRVLHAAMSLEFAIDVMTKDLEMEGTFVKLVQRLSMQKGSLQDSTTIDGLKRFGDLTIDI